MTKDEKEIVYGIYTGILTNFGDFKGKEILEFEYDFNCPEYKELIEKYNLKRIAGKGSSFERAKRLLNYFSRRLYHSSWYDNHIECNALKLLEYSFCNKEQGINCLNKSKILEEVCLAVGIYARRVGIMPFSPYDLDTHVVIEMFDEQMNKWIMMDPTTNGYFINENKTPLSIMEIRKLMAEQKFVTFVRSSDKLDDIYKLKEKRKDTNIYISKNMFRFSYEKYNGFGLKSGGMNYSPRNYSIMDNLNKNRIYKLNNIPPECESIRDEIEKQFEICTKEPPCGDIKFILESPIK